MHLGAAILIKSLPPCCVISGRLRHITFWHIALSTLDNRLKMSSLESEITYEMEVEGHQFEPEFMEEEIESQNFASSPDYDLHTVNNLD